MKKISLLLILVLSAPLCILAAGLPGQGSYDWKNARRVAPGIVMKHFKYDKPRILSIHAVKVDLSNPRIRLIGTPPAANHGEYMPDYPKTKKDYKQMKIQTRRMRVWDYLLERRKEMRDVRLAVNASPWRPWTTPYTHTYACNTGLTVYEGKVVALPTVRTVPSLVVYKNGKADMIQCKVGDKAIVKNIHTALSGFDFVMRNGEILPDKRPALHPRTFYGLSKDRKTLYILVVDGRQKKHSMGMNYAEGASFMKYLGAYDAINMDGGGSTTLVTFQRGKPRLINTPPGAGLSPEKFRHKATRSVATSLGVYLVK